MIFWIWTAIVVTQLLLIALWREVNYGQDTLLTRLEDVRSRIHLFRGTYHEDMREQADCMDNLSDYLGRVRSHVALAEEEISDLQGQVGRLESRLESLDSGVINYLRNLS